MLFVILVYVPLFSPRL